MDNEFDGLVVLVTGGASGIGRAIAEAFGKRKASVVFTYFSSQDNALATATTIEAAGGKALPLYADLTQETEVERVVATVIAQFGAVDIIITNSGGLLQRKKVADCSRELWDQALAVNLTSTFLCCRAVLPHMERAGHGCIITDQF